MLVELSNYEIDVIKAMLPPQYIELCEKLAEVQKKYRGDVKNLEVKIGETLNLKDEVKGQ